MVRQGGARLGTTRSGVVWSGEERFGRGFLVRSG